MISPAAGCLEIVLLVLSRIMSCGSPLRFTLVSVMMTRRVFVIVPLYQFPTARRGPHSFSAPWIRLE